MKDITCPCLAFSRHYPKTNKQLTAKTTATTSMTKWNKNNDKSQINKALAKTSSLLCERNNLPKNITTKTTLTIKANLNDFLMDHFNKKTSPVLTDVLINQQIAFHINSMCINVKCDFDTENTHTNNTDSYVPLK